jgi:hypothetical protein
MNVWKKTENPNRSQSTNSPIFHDEEKAREWFETRIWPNGPFCPHCGETERLTRLHGQKHRPGPLV